jgi:MEMO1 family protein
MTSIRRAAVAGTFYPGDAGELAASVRTYLEQAETPQGPPPKAIIAPHAGYVFSGPVAASAYAWIKPLRDQIKRVILLGPCHRVAVRGLAAPDARVFQTPLGDIPIDRQAVAEILDMPQVQVFDDTHAQEHSLEVHLPFLQVVLGDFALVPLVVGDATPDMVADVLERLWGGPETLIVISTDLSHFLDYEAAQKLDGQTVRVIENLDPNGIAREGACGRMPVSGMLALARRRGLKITTVDVRNSGDTAGSRDRVVGYGSWVLHEGGNKGEDAFGDQTKQLLKNHGATLLHLAAASIRHGLSQGAPVAVNLSDFAPDLRDPGACFVTLKREGNLRGCIGSPQAHRPLAQDVADNGFSAAFRDPRFANLTEPEIEGLQLSISVLSPSSPMAFTSQADLLAKLRPQVDGLIIEDQGRRALFLPSVWESLPTKEGFLGNLKAKAGMKADHWSPGFKAWRFIAEEIHARDLEDPDTLWAHVNGEKN